MEAKNKKEVFHESEKAWENLFKALDLYSILIVDLIYANNSYIRIKEELEEGKFKYCSDAVELSIKTIISCLKTYPGYDFFTKPYKNIVEKFICYFTDFNKRKALDNILSHGNLKKLSGKIIDIIGWYSSELDVEEKNSLADLHVNLGINLIELSSVLTAYNRLKPDKVVFRASEALKKWFNLMPGFKNHCAPG